MRFPSSPAVGWENPMTRFRRVQVELNRLLNAKDLVVHLADHAADLTNLRQRPAKRVLVVVQEPLAAFAHRMVRSAGHVEPWLAHLPVLLGNSSTPTTLMRFPAPIV